MFTKLTHQRMALLRAGERLREHGIECERLRSEEHTSELQSQSNLVCRLLLEKKKKHTYYHYPCVNNHPPPVKHPTFRPHSPPDCTSALLTTHITHQRRLLVVMHPDTNSDIRH